jgi:hypothetical protein
MVNMVIEKVKRTRTKKNVVIEKKVDILKNTMESLSIEADPQVGEEQIDGSVGADPLSDGVIGVEPLSDGVVGVEPLSEEPSDGVIGVEPLSDGVVGVEPLTPKMPKKRGRKPKGGKIVPNHFLLETNKGHEPNIIMHLKCGESDLVQNTFINCEPNAALVETFQFENNKSNELGYSIIDYGVKDTIPKNEIFETMLIDEVNVERNSTTSDKKSTLVEADETRHLWSKLKELTYQLHTNSISDKKSACFWCTCDFDNPTILIPKYELNKTYHCYGCFCSPECATAYLFEEAVDTSTRFERYHLLNHIYCKIYNYEKNIKPAPNPRYTLNKYYGNLSIQEYRKLLKNERLLLIVDKPLSRVLPELHEDNDDYMFNGATISTSNKFKLRKQRKQTKTDILSETFNLKGGAPLQPSC